jgi:hypothetical protein
MISRPRSQSSEVKIVKTHTVQTLRLVQKKREGSQWPVTTCKIISTCRKLREWKNNAQLLKVFKSSIKCWKGSNTDPQVAESPRQVLIYPRFQSHFNPRLISQKHLLCAGPLNHWTKSWVSTEFNSQAISSPLNGQSATTLTVTQNKSSNEYRHWLTTISVLRSKSTSSRVCKSWLIEVRCSPLIFKWISMKISTRKHTVRKIGPAKTRLNLRICSDCTAKTSKL